MGTVYLAEHLAIGRRVAVKVLAAGWSKSADVTRRFRAEARAASAIGHPNIVEVLDADELPDGRPFIVMELLEGRDLLAVLRRDGQLPWVRVCQLGARIAYALHAAHEIGIIHRDLKAENVMLVDGPRGEVVKVLDFGIAVNINDGAERATRPGIAVGTPEYMAPEQARGEQPNASFDIYALGVLMYELLCGEPPFTAANPLEILGRKAVSPAPSIARKRDDIPAELVETVDSCLAMEPGDRPISARVLGERLDALVESSKELERVLVPGAVIPAKTGLEPWAVAVVSAVVLGTAVFLAWPTDDATSPTYAASAIEPDVEPDPKPASVEPVAPPPAPEPGPALVPPVEPTDTVPDEPAPPVAVGKRNPKTKPRVLPSVSPDPAPDATPPPPSGDTEECVRIRREAEDARVAHDWRGILRHTEKGKCWPTGTARKKLRVKAMLELNRFEDCVELGKEATDLEVVAWVQKCRKRLDAKAQGKG